MRTILVSGASGGMGAAIVATLAALPDTRVIAVTRSRAWAPPEGNVVVEVGDIAERDFLAGLVERYPSTWGVINTVGVAGERRAFDTWGVDDLTDMLRINAALTVEFTNAFLPAVRRARGLIVFINSDAGIVSYPKFGAYAASKFALRALTDALRAEEMGNGVRITSLYPGKTDTPLLVQDYARNGWRYQPERYISPEAISAVIRTVVELPPESSITDLVIEPTLRLSPEPLEP